MCSEKQTEANRLNAQKSTGPRTPEGKEKVSQNAVTHGLTAFRPVLANENPEEYTLFRDDFFRHHAPVGILEESLAQRAADSFWRLQRAQDYETSVLNTLIKNAQNPDDSDVSQIENEKSLLGQILLDDFRQTHSLEKIQKYEMSIERSFFRTVKELRQLQSQRLKVADLSLPKGEASSFGSFSKNSKTEQNKANIPTNTPKSNIENRKSSMIDPIKLLENCLANPVGLDPLTKIMMKSDRDRRLAKKAM